MAASDSSDPELSTAKIVQSLLTLSPLFDVLPDVFLYVKDRQSRFVHVNRHWLDTRGFASVEQVVGKTDFDLHPRHLAEQYVAEDQRVMGSGQPLPRQVWLVPGRDGKLDWYESSKFPLRRPGCDEVIGIAGVMRSLETADVPQPSGRLRDVLAHVARSPGEEHAVPDLAAAAGLSVSQFERTFRRLFQMTPRQYVQRVRVNAAAEALLHTDDSVTEIALASGFYDQSHFTKVFGRMMGSPPATYRRRYRDGAGT